MALVLTQYAETMSLRRTALCAALESAAGEALIEDDAPWGEVLLRGIVNAVLNALEAGGHLQPPGDDPWPLNS